MADEMEEAKCCEDCGVDEDEAQLHPYTETEQEYPGAHVWTFTYYYCTKCIKEHKPQLVYIQENTRGW